MVMSIFIFYYHYIIHQQKFYMAPQGSQFHFAYRHVITNPFTM